MPVLEVECGDNLHWPGLEMMISWQVVKLVYGSMSVTGILRGLCLLDYNWTTIKIKSGTPVESSRLLPYHLDLPAYLNTNSC